MTIEPNEQIKLLEESLSEDDALKCLVTLKVPRRWKTLIEEIAARTDSNTSSVVRKMIEPYFKK